MNTKNKIVEQSLKLFFNYGIQHITMDDIAEKCGVSKKTIYKYFENKDDLLHQIIELQVKELKEVINKNQLKKINALEELNLFFKYINGLSRNISATFGKELKKYHSSIFIKVIKYKKTIILPFVLQNIKKGKEEGLYKKNLNAEGICDSFDDISKVVFLDGFFNNSGTNKNTLEFLHSLFLHRLVSVKGLKILKDYSENGAV
ncbi:TetR/AcrR family transcriptional regulator [Xanthomarina gelatinilytica]|jgi:AcrR family transcriptional regulator